MNDKEILLDLTDSFSRWVHWVLDGMSMDTLKWQPDDQANNIAVTVWHFSRAFDVLKVRVMEDRPVEEELWRVRGWVDKTGYDPRGKGWSEFGNLAGYTRDEVEEVPILPVDDLLQYFDEAIEAFQTSLEDIPVEILYENAPGWPAEPQTVYVCIRNFLMDSLGHLGEIRAIKAMKERKDKAA